MALQFLLLPSLAFFLLISASPALSQNNEVNALSAFKGRLSDPEGNLKSWDTSLYDPCTWFHVVCDSNNRVVRLYLMQLNISGQLGPELGQLENLQYLLLYGNDLQGRIPGELGNLKNLVSMDMANNRLVGEIPKSFSNLKSLLFLRLNNNRLTGCIPREVVSLPNLIVLEVSNIPICKFSNRKL